MKKLAPLWPYLRPYSFLLWGGLATTMGNAAVGLLSPLVMGQAVDSLKIEVSGSNLLLYGALVVGISLVQGVFLYLQRMQLVNMSRHVEFDLRNKFFAHLERLEPRFFQQHYTGDLMARATNDLQAVRMVCGPAIMYAANTLFTSLGAVFLMFRIHAGMTFLALSTLPIVAILTRIFGRRIHDLFEAVQEDFSDGAGI
jgi:ATP-binding cassette, subfamily B, multidrug efflux pump